MFTQILSLCREEMPASSTSSTPNFASGALKGTGTKSAPPLAAAGGRLRDP